MSGLTLPAGISLAGTGAFVASVAAMHVLQPELRPVDVAVSYYLNGPSGWLLAAGLVALGVGSVSLAVALQRSLSSRGAGPGFWLLVVWGVGAVIGGIFPPDPYGQWDRPPSLSGMIHGVSGLVAFVAFPPAAWLLSRNLSVSRSMSSYAGRKLERLAGVCAVCLVVFFMCLAPVFQNRAPYALGFVERVLIAAFVAWLVAAALNADRADIRPRTRGLSAAVED